MNSIAKKFWRFLTKKLRLENGAKGHWHLVSYVVLDSIDRHGAYSDSPQFKWPLNTQWKRKSKKETQTTSASSFVTFAIFFAAPFHRSSKWLAARCLLASRFLFFFLFGVVLARPFFPHFSPVDSKTVQRSALCRSRQELSNEYLLAKIGVDTAENEPLKFWRKVQFNIHSPP